MQSTPELEIAEENVRDGVWMWMKQELYAMIDYFERFVPSAYVCDVMVS